jgi:stage V sporulation protein SpoVS
MSYGAYAAGTQVPEGAATFVFEEVAGAGAGIAETVGMAAGGAVGAGAVGLAGLAQGYVDEYANTHSSELNLVPFTTPVTKRSRMSDWISPYTKRTHGYNDAHPEIRVKGAVVTTINKSDLWKHGL